MSADFFERPAVFARAADGCALAYRVAGPHDAPAIVFSHSIGTSQRLWAAQVAALGSRFRVLAYDSRGHGESDAPETGYAIDALSRDLLAILAHAGLSRVTLVGLSLGGLVGQWLARSEPNALDRMVLANTATRFAPRTMWQERITIVRERGIAAISEGAVSRWFTPQFAAREPETVAGFRARLEATSPAGYAGCCATLADADTAGTLGAIATRTTVIVGNSDLATPPHLGEELASGISGARLVRLDAAHLSSVEAAGAFTRTVEEAMHLQ